MSICICACNTVDLEILGYICDTKMWRDRQGECVHASQCGAA